MALLVVRSAGSGEVLADFDANQFQRLVEARSNTVRALKLQLKDKGFGGRFQLRLLNDSTEMQDDEMLVPPLDLKLVRMRFLSFDAAETETFIKACKEGRMEEVETTLKKPQDPNAPNMADGRNALHCSVMNGYSGYSGVVRLLLEAGASCDQAMTDDGATALHYAAMRGHSKVVRLLLEAGASCDQAMTNDGATALHCAARRGRSKVVRLLLEAGASCDQARTTDGATALILTAKHGHHGHLEIVRSLLHARASCDQAMTNDGTTALHYAAATGHSEVVRLLLDAGASRDQARTNDGATALILATQFGHHEIVSLLEAVVRREKRRKVTT